MVDVTPRVHERSRRGRARRRTAAVAAAGAGALALSGLVAALPAAAVNVAQPGIVSADPASFTPQVMNGAVIAMVQVGHRIIAAGTFTTVRQTLTSADITRNRMFAFDATTGQIDPSFNPSFGGAVNSLTTDGTNVYAGGTFSSVGGKSTYKRVVKLDGATGAVDQTFKAVPSSGVNEVVVRGSRLFVGGAFSSIKNGKVTTPRAALAALDATTGAVLADVDVPFTGVYDPATGGATNVKRFDVTPDGSRLVAIGNFSTVGGLPRSQVVVVDTPAGAPAAVDAWATNRFDMDHNDCAGVFDSFTRDLDISPDGTYFVVSATGAFAGGAASGTMCDSTSRWELSSRGNDPTWMDYTGGDTTYGVAITGDAVYVGGHMRYENNPFQGDQAGPGAVSRAGIAALDPVNGLPLSWNPTRDRGVGAQALYATDQGLWVGSDTKKIGHEVHQRLAFFPLAGGTSAPVVSPSTLPNDVFVAPRAAAGSTGVLYRVVAGSPVQASDDGPDWTSDSPYVSGSSNIASWGGPAPVDSTVPSTTPPAVFSTERWSPSDSPAMHYAFPVAAGKQVTVRLYFADRCDCTASAGSRVFDVSIDGQPKLTGFDVDATAGHNKGTMKAFTVTSDGTVDVTFAHRVENPLVDAIEIVDPAGGGTAASTPLLRRPVGADGAPTAAATTASTAMSWGAVRGAFLVNSTLYYGLGDGSLYARPFTASTGAVGAQRKVDLHDDPDDGTRIPFAISNATGMFYDTTLHRLYYTLFGDSHLYYRYFTPESEVVGAQTFVADAGGVDFSTAAGLTLASGRVLYGSSADGALRSVPFAGGAVTGSPTVVSDDGTWTARALLVPNG